jgi:alpha-L-fucosidase
MKSPAKRDLVGELAEQCAKKGLGLCLYYSHGRDWRHPDAPNNDKWGGSARPKYKEKEPAYHYGKDHDLNRYIDYMHAQITELLTHYGPIASMWLDGYGVPASGPIEKFRVKETYALIRKLQPQCLISAKWGYNGDEDYFAPEYHWLERNPKKTKEMLASGKPIEICTGIAGWGYNKKRDGKHRGADSVWENIEYAAKFGANLLLNTGPRGDGSIDPQDVKTLRQIGKRIRKEGWPKKK